MQEDRTYSLFPSDLDLVVSIRNLRDYLVQARYQEDPDGVLTRWRLTVDRTRSLRADDFAGFLSMLEQNPHPDEFSIVSYWKNDSNGRLNVDIDLKWEKIYVTVASQDLPAIAAFHDKIREFFKASNPSPDKSAQLSKYNLKKSVFLAHRFDDEGQRIADKLASFLRAVRFSVVEGEGYEARHIPMKVEERILSQDIFICVVSHGDSSWILSEASFAKAKNKYLVIILQDGVDFNKGIIGSDYEHITFTGEDIEKCFTNLLYALP